jgi:hypothetical protein
MLAASRRAVNRDERKIWNKFTAPASESGRKEKSSCGGEIVRAEPSQRLAVASANLRVGNRIDEQPGWTSDCCALPEERTGVCPFHRVQFRGKIRL